MAKSIRSLRKSRAHIKKLAVHSLRVRRSHKQFYCELVSPEGVVLTSVSTKTPAVIKVLDNGGGNKDAAAALAPFVKKAVDDRGIDKVAFDRSGYVYHGRVKALAEALREIGVIV